MHNHLLRLAALTIGCSLASAFALRANESSDVKGPDEDGTKPALTRIAGEGYLNSHAYEYLEELSDDVGARVTGSVGDHKATDWGVAKMKKIGLENVHAEKYQLWRGWTRGKAEAELIAPLQKPLHIDSMGWTGSTPVGGVEAEVVPFNIFDLEPEIRNASRYSGKIALAVMHGSPKMSSDMIFVRYGDFVRAAAKAHAVAVVGGQGGFKSSGRNLTHTGIIGFDADYSIPVVSMTAEDHAQLERFLEDGKQVRARLNIQNKFSDGPVQTANVVGEIRGRENPEQVFVVGAHLDSWDLSEGATDNGVGSVSVLSAAEAIVRSGMKPRRTIRFVLFTGEEQGLDGSFAYLKQHQAELANHLGDIVLDNGQGPVREFQLGGRDDLVATFRPFARAISLIREIPVSDSVEPGTDTLPFSMVGLPGINLDQDSPDYKYTHHSAADSLEEVKPDVLAQNATIMALAAFWIADRPERFAAPWPSERTARMLRAHHQYDFLKAFGLWKFGDLGTDRQDTP
jgi:carboxypeptidase Q